MIPKSNGHKYVDLGLSVKWATCNVGADTPEDDGEYYAWGETETKSFYSWSTYKWCKGSETTLTKYCDWEPILNPEDDVAHVKWGGDWRMPTSADWSELTSHSNCTWAWTIQGEKTGYTVTSKINGNSIFLPSAGYRLNNSLYNVKKSGYWCMGKYWSSNGDRHSSEPSHSYYLGFDSEEFRESLTIRCAGLPVRPVCP